MAKATPTATITDLAQIASETMTHRAKLLSGTELATVPFTEHNEHVAVETVNLLTAQTRAIMQLSAERRGMFLIWLKRHKTNHGEGLKLWLNRAEAQHAAVLLARGQAGCAFAGELRLALLRTLCEFGWGDRDYWRTIPGHTGGDWFDGEETIQGEQA